MDEFDNTPVILLACKDPKIRLEVKGHLIIDYHVVEAKDLEEILYTLGRQSIHFIFLDEEIQGIEICKRLREIKRFQYLPILMVLKEHDGKLTKEAIQAGITNFITLPTNREAVICGLLVAERFSKTVQEMTSFSHKLKGLAEHDPLTNLYNRYFLFDHGVKEFAKASRGHFPLSLLMIDIDHFKDVNDLHGHLIGDIVLMELASFIIKNQRSYDIAARYGGEEFLLLLPNTTKEQAYTVAEKIRSSVAQNSFSSEKLKITLSIGVSTLSDDIVNLEQLIQAADFALYQSKLKGRDQVTVA